MEINILPNPLYEHSQTLTIKKVATLIGENGSGKSNILQSIFEQKLSRNDHQELNVVCFSSGQNERFSKKFSQHLNSERRAGRGLSLECFYFDKSWSKILIFLATALKANGKVRTFLRDNDYLGEVSELGDDLTTKLKAKFKVDKKYIDRVQEALIQERNGETRTLRSTPYYRTLENFINTLITSSFEFDTPLRKCTIEIAANQLIDISFDAKPTFGFGPNRGNYNNSNYHRSRIRPEISFFMQAADNNYFIDKSSNQLFFKNGIEFDLFSDGEYQLLFLYALIDLFDKENTLFLFDEVDSHLHYGNIKKLWSLLHSIEGKVVTTTHLLDSISAPENKIEHLIAVKQGRISDEDKVKELLKRLNVLSQAKSIEFELSAKLPNIALLDDYNDWTIFTKLAERAGLDLEPLSAIYAVKKTSSYATIGESFGRPKIDWLHSLSKVESPISTENIFMICDRDEAALDWNARNGVQVNGYRDLLPEVQWPQGINVSSYMLAWKRREIKNYLLS